MTDFPGFTSSETFTSVPDSLFRLLGEIDDLDELRLTLYVLWRLEHLEARMRGLSRSEMVADDDLMRGFTAGSLESGLDKAVRRGTLLRVTLGPDGVFFLNSPTGRAAAEALLKDPGRRSAHPGPAPRESSNIFKLYEENIGPLTPLISDMLQDAEKTYTAGLIAEAFGEAVKNNVRKWSYVEGILRRKKEEGHAEKQDRPNTQADRSRSIDRKIEELRRRSE